MNTDWQEFSANRSRQMVNCDCHRLSVKDGTARVEQFAQDLSGGLDARDCRPRSARGWQRVEELQIERGLNSTHNSHLDRVHNLLTGGNRADDDDGVAAVQQVPFD